MVVNLRSDRIDLAHVRPSPSGRPEVASLASFRKEGAAEEALARLRKEWKLGSYRCVTLLAPGEYQMLSVDAPNVPAEELRNAVRWRIKDMIDYPVQSATLDVLDIPLDGAPPGRPKSLFAVVASNAVIGPRMALFDEAGVPLDAIDVPETAQRNIAALFEPDNRGLALLNFDEQGGLLTFTYRGELYASRRIEITQEQLAQADGERRSQLLDRIALELQRSLDHFDRQYSHIPLARLLVAPLPDMSEALAFLAANLYVPVEELKLGEGMGCTAVPDLNLPLRQSQWLLALGAALRPQEARA
ncbi:MAG: agglutinin biogenesis protein MshI [Pseudomonadota bacterium]